MNGIYCTIGGRSDENQLHASIDILSLIILSEKRKCEGKTAEGRTRTPKFQSSSSGGWTI